jgi:uncharacterized protein (TIGR03086 family)
MHIKTMVELDQRAVAETVRIVTEWDGRGADRPTPCAGWTLADLLAHVTVQQHGFARAARGENTALADWHPVAVDEPKGAYRAASDDVVDAFAGLDDPDAPMHLPEVGADPVPAGLAVRFHLVDNVVHAWDLARSLGVDVRLDDEVLAAGLAVARNVPDDDRREQPGSPFARALAVPGGTGALEETLLLLGRDPEWRP